MAATQPEWGTPVFSTSSRTIIPTGAIGPYEMTSIANYCEQLHRCGHTALHLDMTGVTDCHGAGLDGLLALAGGSAGMAVSVDGARWQHFMLLLSTAPGVEVEALCDSVRELLPRPGLGSS